MGYIINDWRCKKCGTTIMDYMSKMGEEVKILCPDCNIYMTKVPHFGITYKEFPDFVRSEAAQALDPVADSTAYRKAINGHMRREEWAGIMKQKGYARTDASELEQFKKIKEKRKKGDTPEEHQRTVDKMARALQKNEAITVRS